MSVKKIILWGIFIAIIILIAIVCFNPSLRDAFMEGYNGARQH